MRCVAIHGAERVRLGLGLSSVLTGDAEGSRVAFWPHLATDGGGFVKNNFQKLSGMPFVIGNPLP